MKKGILVLVVALAMGASVYGVGLDITPKFMVGGSKTVPYLVGDSVRGTFGAHFGGQVDFDIRFANEKFGIAPFVGISALPFGFGNSEEEYLYSSTCLNLGAMAKFYLENNLSFGVGLGIRGFLASMGVKKVYGAEVDRASSGAGGAGAILYLAGSAGYTFFITDTIGLLLEANIAINSLPPVVIFDFGAAAGVRIRAF